MRKLLSIVLALTGILFAVNSCKKTGGNINPLSDVKNNGIGSYLVLDSTVNLNLNYSNLSGSVASILVEGYSGGEAVDHIVLFATPGSSYDTTKWHMVKSVPYAGKKTKLAVSANELAAALGVNPTALTPGTSYTIYTRVVTKTGKTYDVNNTGNNSGSGLVTGPFYYSAFYFTAYVTCPFTGNMAGTYKVMADDWADWSKGDLVQVTDGPGVNQINLSQVWPNPAYGSMINPLIIDIAPASGTASVKKVDFADYGSIATAAYGSGYVFSCVGYITLSIDVVYGGGDQGSLRLILQKQ